MIDMWNIAKNLLASVAPAAIIVFSILASWSFLKWMGKLGLAIKDLGQKPASIILVIIVAGVMFYFYYQFVAQYL